MQKVDKAQEKIYPCDTCGKMRSKDEGGTTFTVCDECWDAHRKLPKDRLGLREIEYIVCSTINGDKENCDRDWCNEQCSFRLPRLSEVAKGILALIPDKITEKPPLLSDEEMDGAISKGMLNWVTDTMKKATPEEMVIGACEGVAQAQRESDWKFYGGKEYNQWTQKKQT